MSLNKTAFAISARIGSKRIKKKNIKNFNGKPIILYPLETAMESGLFDEIIVSSDDFGTLAIADKNNSITSHRRAIPEHQNLSEALTKIISGNSLVEKGFSKIVLSLATAVFYTEFDLITALNKHVEGTNTICVVPYSHPIERAMHLKFKPKEGSYLYMNPEMKSRDTQSFATNYHDAGQFYIVDIKHFMSCKKIISNKSRPYFINPEYVVDIDNPSDWKRAEWSYKAFTAELDSLSAS